MNDDELARCEAAYRETGNGAFAWRAFALCQAAGAEPPAWVTRYLSEVAARLDALQSDPPRKFAEAVAEAVGVKRTAAPRRSKVIAARAAAETVMRRLGGDKKDALVLDAVDASGVSESSIWRALRRGWKVIVIRPRSTVSIELTVNVSDATDSRLLLLCKKEGLLK